MKKKQYCPYCGHRIETCICNEEELDEEEWFDEEDD